MGDAKDNLEDDPLSSIVAGRKIDADVLSEYNHSTSATVDTRM
jgi:hypothetical protein